MSSIINNLRAAYQEVHEKLKGDQHKLDHDGDGDIDGKDFAMLRAKKKKKTEENTPGRMSDVDGKDITKKKKSTYEDTHASADKKPEKYHDEDGKEKTRMVPTKKRKRDKDEGDVDMNPKLEKGSNAATEQKESSEVSEDYGAMKDAEAHAKKDGKNYKDVSVQHKYDAYHMKKRGYTHFETGRYGTRKYHKGDVAGATEITSDHHRGVSESLTIREKLLSVLSENDRAKHYKGATKPETMDDKLKGKGAKDMMNQPKEVDDTETKGHDDASKAGRVTKPAKQRNGGDQVRSGDQKVVNPIKKMKETYLAMQKGESDENI